MLIENGDRRLAAMAATTAAHDPFSSRGDVTYSQLVYTPKGQPWERKICLGRSYGAFSCGSCGYALNLSSSNRNTTNFGSKYGKAIKKGVISFFSVDESRFSKSDEYRCIPYISKNSWGLFRRRTKLLCRKCGNHIGVAYDESYKSENSDSSCGNGASAHKKYNIKISALQPSSDESLIPFSYDLCTKDVTSTYIG